MGSLDNADTAIEYFASDKNCIPCNDDYDRLRKQVNLPRKWSELSYAGEYRVPQGYDPGAGSWPLIFLRRNEKGQPQNSGHQ